MWYWIRYRQMYNPNSVSEKESNDMLYKGYKHVPKRCKAQYKLQERVSKAQSH